MHAHAFETIFFENVSVVKFISRNIFNIYFNEDEDATLMPKVPEKKKHKKSYEKHSNVNNPPIDCISSLNNPYYCVTQPQIVEDV